MNPLKPIASLNGALQLLSSFTGKPEEFQLAVPEAQIDGVGINMAIITDHVLSRGLQPDGFTQDAGYRIYRYKTLD